jgi:hypothetical protein
LDCYSIQFLDWSSIHFLYWSSIHFWIDPAWINLEQLHTYTGVEVICTYWVVFKSILKYCFINALESQYFFSGLDPGANPTTTFTTETLALK